MAWTYSQSTGNLEFNGTFIASGYSGHGDGVNNPADESIRDVGPLPQGTYTIGAPFTHPVCGPESMRLTPDPTNEMFGRDGFLIHGDTAAMNHTASDGCIIMPPAVRQQIATSDDTTLIVIA